MSRSFYAFIATQLLGAFNDNLFKQLILFLAASILFPGVDKQGLAFAVFALPFVLFSGLAGDLSERYSKQKIMVAMKWLEIVIMLLGAVALQSKDWNLMLLVLFVMGAQSAFFGPAKYGAIPEMVKPKDLIRANGAVTMTTFIAVLAGGALAGPLLDRIGDRLWLSGVACIGLAVLGTFTASRIQPLSATRPNHVVATSISPLTWPAALFSGLASTIRRLSRRQGLMSIVLLNSLYYFNAGVFNQAVVGMGAPELLDIGAGNQKQLSAILATLSVSVAVGAVLTPALAKRIAPGRLVIGGALLMALAQGLMNLVATVVTKDAGALLLMHLCAATTGLFGAVVVVPLASYLQFAPEPGMRGMTFGVTNFFNFLCLFLAGLFYLVLRGMLGISPAIVQSASAVFLIAGLGAWRRRISAINFA